MQLIIGQCRRRKTHSSKINLQDMQSTYSWILSIWCNVWFTELDFTLFLHILNCTVFFINHYKQSQIQKFNNVGLFFKKSWSCTHESYIYGTDVLILSLFNHILIYYEAFLNIVSKFCVFKLTLQKVVFWCIILFIWLFASFSWNEALPLLPWSMTKY